SGGAMRLLVGLGNPGSVHAHNRHNIGFMAVERICRACGFGPWRARFQGLIAEGTIGETKVLALKPGTFMNLSGQAVGEAARFHKIAPEDVIVLHDEIELLPGRIRVKLGGGSAGHNGIKSIDAHIGPETWRVRLGVGRPAEKTMVKNYVLHDFTSEDQAWLEPFLDAVATAAPHLIAGDENKFMTKVALLTKPPKDDAKETSNTEPR
ncbi:MAG: aminoacyl-tRNA hydrolase, partial [Rhodospirillaceae bacterium]|nr:aminoacyl-tRNA hydrolase [Rhodospirillaceae bacterium]